MKNRKIVWLLAVLAVLIIFAGCKNKLGSDTDTDTDTDIESESENENENESESDILQLPDAMPASSVQKFSGTAVANDTEAWNLFDDMFDTDFFDMLLEADKLAFTDAFKKAYGKADVEKYGEAFVAENPDATSISYSVNINDTKRYKAKSGANAAKISGSESFSISSNLAIKKLIAGTDFVDALKNNGDNYAAVLSGNRTCEISDGFYVDAPIKIAGFVIVEYDASVAVSLVDKVEDMFSLDQNLAFKASMTLSVSNGTKGAKFRFSGAASMGFDYVIPRSMSQNMIVSDIEVYDNNNVLLFTVQGDPDMVVQIAGAFMFNNNDTGIFMN